MRIQFAFIHGVSEAESGAPRPGGSAATPRRPERARLSSLRCSRSAAGLSPWWWVSRPRAHGPNLILITVDTLRADHVGVYGATSGATPTLDALARRGARFDQVQTAVPLTGPVARHDSDRTVPADTRRPRQRRLYAWRDLSDAGDATEAPRLHDGGVRRRVPGRRGVRIQPGLRHVRRGVSRERPARRRRRTTRQRGGRRVAAMARRGGATVHSSPGCTSTIRMRPTILRLLSRAFRRPPYDGEIAFTDAQVGRVLESLHASGHDRDTVVMVLADHGEGLGEHHELTHAVLTYQSTMRVPWIVAGPGIPARSSTCGRASRPLTSCRPRSGCSAFDADRALLGRDLRPLLDGRTVASDPFYQESLFGRLNCHWAALRGWVKDDWKLITGAAARAVQPRGRSGRAAQPRVRRADRVRRMTDDLQRGLQRLAPGGDRAQPRAVSAEQEERLRSLGYTAGSGGAGPLDDPSLPDPRHARRALRPSAGCDRRAGSGAGARLRRRAADYAGSIPTTRLRSARSRRWPTDTAACRSPRGVSRARSTRSRSARRSPELRQAPARAATLLRLGARTAARCRAERRRRADPREPRRYAGRRTQRRARPRALVDAVLAKEPADPEALGVKGRLLAAQGRINDALPYFEKSAAGSDAEPLHRTWPRVRDGRRSGEGARRRRRGAAPQSPATHGRWPCSATSWFGTDNAPRESVLSNAPSPSARDGRSSGRRWPTASMPRTMAPAPKSVAGRQPR